MKPTRCTERVSETWGSGRFHQCENMCRTDEQREAGLCGVHLRMYQRRAKKREEEQAKARVATETLATVTGIKARLKEEYHLEAGVWYRFDEPARLTFTAEQAEYLMMVMEQDGH